MEKEDEFEAEQLPALLVQIMDGRKRLFTSEEEHRWMKNSFDISTIVGEVGDDRFDCAFIFNVQKSQ